MIFVVFPHQVVPIKISTPEHVVGGKGEHFIWVGVQVEAEHVDRTVVIAVIIDIKDRA